MKTAQLISLFFVILLAGCTIKRESVVPLGTDSAGAGIPKLGTGINKPLSVTVANPTGGAPTSVTVVNYTGDWKAATGGAGGFNATETFKNFQYNFEVAAANSPVAILLNSSDINVQFALFDPLGQRVDITSAGRSPYNQYTLNAGIYRVVIMAERQAVGKFIMSLSGAKAAATRIAAQVLQSGTQDWGTLGGGGNVKSTKNHFYSFDITDDNTTIDLEIESADTETSLILYNNLDVAVIKQWGKRYLFQLVAAKKGTYTVMAGTTNRGDVGSYKLRVFGKVTNLQPIPSVTSAATGNWPSGTSFDTYSIQIDANNSPLDIDLASPDIDVRITLQNNVGDRIDATCCPYKSTILTYENVSKGIYRIVVQSYITRPGPGKYSMNVFGRFTDFRKL